MEQARVRLVMVGGAPGSGKSTVAAALAANLGWTLFRSDELRKELARLPALAHADSGYGESLYSSELSDKVYGELVARARTALGMGESVVIDAT